MRVQNVMTTRVTTVSTEQLRGRLEQRICRRMDEAYALSIAIEKAPSRPTTLGCGLTIPIFTLVVR